jgi:hypothetical protein
MPPSYAVLFKAHSWEPFVQRQYDRLAARVRDGQLFALVNESRGPVAGIEAENVVRYTVADTTRLGLAEAAPWGDAIWYNVDYPLYYFRARHPDFAYYAMAEYDVVVKRDFDSLIEEMAERRLDYAGFPLRTRIEDWGWTVFHQHIYSRDILAAYLSCLGIFSARAVEFLFERRLQFSAQHRARPLPFWPNNEAFIATELKLGGFAIESLSAFGNTDHYDWWPPTHEDDLAGLDEATFLHPVLDGERYGASLLRHHRDLLSYLDPRSDLRKKLARFPRTVQWRRFVVALAGRVSEALKRRVWRRIGIFIAWRRAKAGAAAGVAGSEEIKSKT